MDSSLIKELFLHRLPSNVRMIPALTAKRSTLEELAEMAVNTMEVVLQSIATVAVPQSTSEVGKFLAKVVSLRKLLLVLQSTGRHRRNGICRSNMLYFVKCAQNFENICLSTRL